MEYQAEKAGHCPLSTHSVRLVCCRGFTAAALGEAADGVEDRHPRLIGIARSGFRPILDTPYISRRLQEVWLSKRAAFQYFCPRCRHMLYNNFTPDTCIWGRLYSEAVVASCGQEEDLGPLHVLQAEAF